MTVLVAVLSALAGALPFALAFTDLDAMPLRFAAAALAAVLALPCLRRTNPVSSRLLGGIGLVLGGLYLLLAGLLWLLWPG